MVVCKCRKATKLYCFVHKTPVCFDCICTKDHEICVVNLYSKWVNDGDYDWPPKCSLCNESLQDTQEQTTRLSCLHVLHTACLQKHIESYPPYTAPAGYSCGECSAPIWPPKNQKEAATTLFTNIRAVIGQTQASNVLLSLNASSSAAANAGAMVSEAAGPVPPPAFASAPLANHVGHHHHHHDSTRDGGGANAPAARGGAGGDAGAAAGAGGKTSENGSLDAVAAAAAEAEAAAGAAAALGASSSHLVGPNSVPSPRSGPSPALAVPRKSSYRPAGHGGADATGNDNANDDDGSERKYARRGGLLMQSLRSVSWIWSPALQALPVTYQQAAMAAAAAAGKDKDARDGAIAAEDMPRRGTRAGRRSTMDPRKVLLIVAIASCMATMLLLYYRLAQASFSGDENQTVGGSGTE